MAHKIKVSSKQSKNRFSSDEFNVNHKQKKIKNISILIIMVILLSIGTYYLYSNISDDSPPVAEAGSNQTIIVNNTVVLNGTGEDDGHIILYEWDFEGDGTYDWNSTINGTVIHTYNIIGNFTAIFRVTDNDNLSNIDSCFITVKVPVANLTILNHRSFIDPQTVFEIVGEVENTGDINLMDIKITANFYDINDNLVGYPNSTTYISILKAGQKSPFMIARYEGSHYYMLEATYVETEMEPYSSLIILNETSEYFTIWGQEVYQISGEILNNGSLISDSIEIVVTFYDSSNNVIGGGLSTIVNPSSIDSNEIASFTFNINPEYLAGTIDYYEIQVQCS